MGYSLVGRCRDWRSVVLAAFAFSALPVAALAQEPPRLRWELLTSGTSDLGSGEGSSTAAPIPKLTGPDATFLFRLDAQPLLNYGSSSQMTNARLGMHLLFQTGVISVGRAVTAKADTAASPAVDVLENQGAVVTDTTAEGATLSRQQAFTAGAEFSANRLVNADGAGVFMELGGVAKGYFDAFLDDARFFEKDGITYVKVSSPLGSETGYFRYELGFRFRLSQNEESENLMDVGGMMKGGNTEDLLLFEFLYQRNNAVEGLLPETGVDTANRWVMRFKATPQMPGTMGKKNTKFLLGLEVSNDLRNRGVKDVRIFYGANMDMKALFQ